MNFVAGIFKLSTIPRQNNFVKVMAISMTKQTNKNIVFYRTLHHIHVHWGVSQIPPNQKLALRIVRYDISTHMEAVCEKVGCCDKSIRSHIGLENWQFCVVSLVTLQIGTFEHLATQNTMLKNPYFFCLFSSKRLYISQLCQQYIVIAYLFNNWMFLQNIFAKPHE